MKKIIAFLILINFSIFFAEEKTARQLANEAEKKESVQDAITFLYDEIDNISVPSEKRAIFAFLAGLEETLSLYDNAQMNYAKAASISAKDAQGMQKKSSEDLVLDAVRCALCAGESENALNYLNSAVRNSKKPEIQAYIKLYEQWAKIVEAENYSETEESIELLKTYLSLSSMQYVKPSILLTLWYMTKENGYADILKKEFPDSIEAEIIKGNVQLKPIPFWLFIPRKNEKVISTEKTETAKLQLGLFKDKANAEAFLQKVKAKGFSPYINEETKESGNTYYSVFVNENEEKTISLELKTFGFESYPFF